MILCNSLRNVVAIFCQTLPLTMKNKSQNTAGGGRAAKGNFRQHEIRGQRCRRGRFSSNHFFLVRIYYLKNANYQGFRPDWPVKLCSFFELSRRNFLPSWCRMKIIGQSLFERRRKSGEPLPKSGDGVCGFGGFGIAANFLQSLQRPSAVSCQSPGDDENNFSPTGGAGNQNAFCFIMKHLPICFRVGFQFGGRINDPGQKHLVPKWNKAF